MLSIFIAPYSLSPSRQIYDTLYIINHFPRRHFKYIFISECDEESEAKFISNLQINLPKGDFLCLTLCKKAINVVYR